MYLGFRKRKQIDWVYCIHTHTHTHTSVNMQKPICLMIVAAMWVAVDAAGSRYVITFIDGNASQQFHMPSAPDITRSALVDKWYGRRIII